VTEPFSECCALGIEN